MILYIYAKFIFSDSVQERGGEPVTAQSKQKARSQLFRPAQQLLVILGGLWALNVRWLNRLVVLPDGADLCLFLSSLPCGRVPVFNMTPSQVLALCGQQTHLSLWFLICFHSLMFIPIVWVNSFHELDTCEPLYWCYDDYFSVTGHLRRLHCRPNTEA